MRTNVQIVLLSLMCLLVAGCSRSVPEGDFPPSSPEGVVKQVISDIQARRYDVVMKHINMPRFVEEIPKVMAEEAASLRENMPAAMVKRMTERQYTVSEIKAMLPPMLQLSNEIYNDAKYIRVQKGRRRNEQVIVDVETTIDGEPNIKGFFLEEINGRWQIVRM